MPQFRPVCRPAVTNARRGGFGRLGNHGHRPPPQAPLAFKLTTVGPLASPSRQRPALDGAGRTLGRVEKGDVEARVGIEPAYTALQAAA